MKPVTYFQSASTYFGKIWRLRFFWLSLVRSDLRSRYRRSMIGIGWSLLQPIAMAVVLCVVFSTLFNIEVRKFCPFLITGLVTWNFMVGSIMQGMQSLFQGESYLRQSPTPVAVFPLRTTLGVGFHFLLGLLVAIGLTWCMRGFGNVLYLPAVLMVLPPLLILGWSLAVVFGLMNVMFQDTQHLIEVGLQILFYLTPIMYPPTMLQERGMGWLIECNPVTPFLEMIRQPIVESHLPSPTIVALAMLYACVAAAGASLLLSRYERRIIFYL